MDVSKHCGFGSIKGEEEILFQHLCNFKSAVKCPAQLSLCVCAGKADCNSNKIRSNCFIESFIALEYYEMCVESVGFTVSLQ